METKEINLQVFRGVNSTLFTGRPQGEKAREDLELEQKDKSKDKYTFIIPKGSTSLNPSFYLGLLFKSIEKLGIKNFEKKYNFKIEDEEDPLRVDRVKILKNNLEDGKRNALNSLKGTSLFNRFFK